MCSLCWIVFFVSKKKKLSYFDKEEKEMLFEDEGEERGGRGEIVRWLK